MSSSASASIDPQPSSTATSGIEMTRAELLSVIQLARSGSGASASLTGSVSGDSEWKQSFIGNIDVDSGTATGQAATGLATARDRIIIGSTMYTHTSTRWIAVSLDSKGIPAGDIRLLWSLLGKVIDARKTTKAGATVITGALPAQLLVQNLGAAADTTGSISAAATGGSAQVMISTDSDGFITSISIASTFNVSGTPTTANLRVKLSDYGQIVDVRKPITGPLQTPEGQ
jgi:hypothetical protein